MTALPEAEAALLRRAFALARAGRAAGALPFGAVIADAGAVIAEAFNTEALAGDPTAHAEMNALRLALRAVPAARLKGASCYASCEPCAMCAGAIALAGLGRVVFGAPKGEPVLAAGPARPGIGLRCAEILARAPQPVEVIGPCLLEEARAVLR